MLLKETTRTLALQSGRHAQTQRLDATSTGLTPAPGYPTVTTNGINTSQHYGRSSVSIKCTQPGQYPGMLRWVFVCSRAEPRIAAKILNGAVRLVLSCTLQFQTITLNFAVFFPCIGWRALMNTFSTCFCRLLAPRSPRARRPTN